MNNDIARLLSLFKFYSGILRPLIKLNLSFMNQRNLNLPKHIQAAYTLSNFLLKEMN